MTDAPQGIDNPISENTNRLSERVETADGTKVLLFRYDNPHVSRGSSGDSRDELVGSWFTDSPTNLKMYIKARPPGGNILVLAVVKDRLASLKAANHSLAKDLDIEPLDDYIISSELSRDAQVIPFTVTSRATNKFLFQDWESVNNAVDEIVKNLQSYE